MDKNLKQLKSLTLTQPDDVRTFDKGKVEVFSAAGGFVGRVTFEPGWKWSECIASIAKTKTCQAEHVGYQLSGTMHIKMDDGGEFDVGPGELFYIPPGHDGWVVGDEVVVALDFNGMRDYAKKAEEPAKGRRAQRRH